MSKFIQHVLTTTGTRIIVMSMGFLQGVIIARYLLPEGRGFIAVYLAVINMLLPLSELGIKQSSSFFWKKKGVTLSEIINTQTITLIFSSLLTWLFLSIIYFFQELIDMFVIIFIFLSIPLRIYISYSSSIALASREINTINIIQFLLVTVDLVMVIVLFIVFKKGADNYFMAYFVSSFISALYILVWLKNKHGVSFRFDLQEYIKIGLPIVKKGITYALPLFVIGLNYSADILVLNYYVNKSEIGIYTVGVTLTVLLWQLPSILNTLIFSYSISTKYEDEFSLKLWNKSKVIMIFLLPIVVLITLSAKYFIPIIYGNEFARSFDVLVRLMPGVYMMVIFKLLNGDLAARGHPMVAFYIFSVGAILNIVLNIILIQKLGIEGAALASSVSYIFCSVIFAITYKRFIDKLIHTINL